MNAYGIDISQAAARSILLQAAAFASPTTAERWDQAVTEAIQSLRHSPERGILCGFGQPRLLGLRQIPIKGFPTTSFCFEVAREEKVVRVVEVLDGRRDLSGIAWPPP